MFVLLLELKYELTFELLYVPVTVLKMFTPLARNLKFSALMLLNPEMTGAGLDTNGPATIPLLTFRYPDWGSTRLPVPSKTKLPFTPPCGERIIEVGVPPLLMVCISTSPKMPFLLALPQ
jgi:hypothetical protein